MRWRRSCASRATPPASSTVCCCWPARIPARTVSRRRYQSTCRRSVRTPRIARPSSPPPKTSPSRRISDPTSIVVDGDETALRRLLLILVDNAIKYTPPGGRVDVRLAIDGQAALYPHLGHGYRDRRRGPAARLRPILARRQSANPIGGRHWPWTGDRALDCGPSRRDNCRLERGRSRVRVYGEAAAGTRVELAGAHARSFKPVLRLPRHPSRLGVRYRSRSRCWRDAFADFQHEREWCHACLHL